VFIEPKNFLMFLKA